MPEDLGTVAHRLDSVPRTEICADPTPLEPLRNLGRQLGATIYAKRDDVQPLAFGGNKVRQLEFYFGAALAEGADTVLITGAVQSNFCRLAAAFAARLGLSCHIQHEERVPKTVSTYRGSGNVLVERMLGATLHSYPHGEDEAGADAALEALADKLRSEGRRPYVIHLAPGHPPLGALGYVVAAREILAQLEAQEVPIDEVVVASGSGATHAGLLFGLRAFGSPLPVTGVCVRRDAEVQQHRIAQRCEEIAALLGMRSPVSSEDVVLSGEQLAPGYGQLNEATLEAIRLGAQTEALMLDPVYTGKAMAGLIARARAQPGQRLLFVHTGGTPGIFAYAEPLTEALMHAAS